MPGLGGLRFPRASSPALSSLGFSVTRPRPLQSQGLCGRWHQVTVAQSPSARSPAAEARARGCDSRWREGPRVFLGPEPGTHRLCCRGLGLGAVAETEVLGLYPLLSQSTWISLASPRDPAKSVTSWAPAADTGEPRGTRGRSEQPEPHTQTHANTGGSRRSPVPSSCHSSS